MRFKKTLLLLPIGLWVLSLPARSQTVEVNTDRSTLLAATSPTVVPMLVRYDGVAPRGDNSPATGKANITFVIYKEASGGDPLWIETQSVETDAAGRYWAYLGATYSSGLPANLFGSGEARWLEVQIAGGTIQPRTLLTSVPYALKAADAATLGGLPASAFALAGTTTPVASSAQPNGITDASASNVTTTGGTSLYLPKFNGASTIINSQIYDNGTSVGIGDVPNASAKLDVNGPMIMRGNMTVSRTGNATSSKAYPSYGFDFFSNVYNSSTKATDNPYFQLQSEPTGNDTSSPSATFNLLFSRYGTAPEETGFSINGNGTVNFAIDQTFLSTSPYATAVDGTSTTGFGVEGTSYSNVGIAGYSTTSSGIYGNTVGNTSNTAGVAGQAGSGSGMTGGVAGVRGDGSTQIGVLGTSSSNSGVQGNSNSGTGVAGSSNTANGVLGYTAGGTLKTAGVTGQAGSLSGFTGIAGVWGDSSAHVGVFGSSTQYAGVAGLSTSGPGVQGSSTNGPGIQGSSTNSYAGQFTSSNSAGTLYASNSTSVGGAGVQGISSGRDGVGVQGNAQGDGGTAVEGISTGGADSSGNPPVGVYGYSSGDGIKGFSSTQVGVYGVGAGSSTSYDSAVSPYVVGVWGDVTGATSYQIAVLGTAKNGIGGEFETNSDNPTVYIYNYGSGGGIFDPDVKSSGDGESVTAGQYGTVRSSDTAVPFRTLEASSRTGTCGFGDNGGLTCTGQLKSLATMGSGAKTVETYSMQSPENWMEDFGSGTLQSGSATVALEAGFAETVSGTPTTTSSLRPMAIRRGCTSLRRRRRASRYGSPAVAHRRSGSTTGSSRSVAASRASAWST